LENSQKQKQGDLVRMSSNGSPITGVIDENLVIIDFGKYEGKSVLEVAEIDPDFYQKLASEKESGVFAIRRHRDKTFRLYVNPLSNIEN
jgi:broad specificity phosphatase PhoE